jgi:hypothetical protein
MMGNLAARVNCKLDTAGASEAFSSKIKLFLTEQKVSKLLPQLNDVYAYLSECQIIGNRWK